MPHQYIKHLFRLRAPSLCVCFNSASLLGAFLSVCSPLRRGAEVREAGRGVFERTPNKKVASVVRCEVAQLKILKSETQRKSFDEFSRLSARHSKWSRQRTHTRARARDESVNGYMKFNVIAHFGYFHLLCGIFEMTSQYTRERERKKASRSTIVHSTRARTHIHRENVSRARSSFEYLVRSLSAKNSLR